MSRIPRWSWWYAPAALLVYLVGTTESQTSYTCTHCRALRHCVRCLGIDYAHLESTDYTQWYETAQPKHVHQWGWCGGEQGLMFTGCGRPHTVYEIPEEGQKEFVLHASLAALKVFYDCLDSPDVRVQRRAEYMVLFAAISRGEPAIVREMLLFAGAGDARSPAGQAPLEYAREQLKTAAPAVRPAYQKTVSIFEEDVAFWQRFGASNARGEAGR